MKKQTTPIYVGYIENNSYVNAYVTYSTLPKKRFSETRSGLRKIALTRRTWGDFRKNIIAEAVARGCKAWIAYNDTVEVVA